MALNTWDDRALRTIADEFGRSAPEFASSLCAGLCALSVPGPRWGCSSNWPPGAALGVNVASAKFLAGRDIEDPGREEEMLASMADGLNAAGDSQGTGLAFFLDQIEASKVIQRGLYARWREHSAEAPANSRDLAGEVRPEPDAINEEILPLVVHVADLAPVPYGQLGDLFDRVLRTSPSVPERAA